MNLSGLFVVGTGLYVCLKIWTAPVVVSVSDGDTLVVKSMTGRETRIRLWGIDSPELDQLGGLESRRYLLLLAKSAGWLARVKSKRLDKHGRTVARVYFNGRCASEALISAGFAWWYEEYAPKATYLGALQETARRKRRGLWQDEMAIAPWEWREIKKGNG